MLEFIMSFFRNYHLYMDLIIFIISLIYFILITTLTLKENKVLKKIKEQYYFLHLLGFLLYIMSFNELFIFILQLEN